MSIDETIAELLRAERRRTASILRDVAECVSEGALNRENALRLAAKHIEHGDENGALFVECQRCHTPREGKRRRTELPIGSTATACGECGLAIKWEPR